MKNIIIGSAIGSAISMLALSFLSAVIWFSYIENMQGQVSGYYSNAADRHCSLLYGRSGKQYKNCLRGSLDE